MIVGGHGGVADDGLFENNSNGSNGGNGGNGGGSVSSANDDKITYNGHNVEMGKIYREKFTDGSGSRYESTVKIASTGPNFIRSEDKIAEEMIELMNEALDSVGFSGLSEVVDATARSLVQDWMNGRPIKTPIEIKQGKSRFVFNFD